MHTRIDWSCRALGSVSMGPPVSLLPSAGHCEQSQKLCFVSLNSGVEIVTLFSGSVPEPEEEGSVHWPGVGDGGTEDPEWSSGILNPEKLH